MKKQTFDDYLFQGIQKLNFDGEIQLNWDQAAFVFELNFTIQVANANQTDLEWADDSGSEPLEDAGVVNYEDSILFYDKNRLNGADYQEDYLKVIDFAGKKGLSKAVLDAFLANLQDTLDDGESDLMDFLDADSTAEVFELTWDQARYEAYLAKQPEANQRVYLPYPRY